MAYSQFHETFPALARKETRSFSIHDDEVVPDGEYGLIELYCDDLDCDCRRVIFNILSANTRQIVAVITYGWETEEFYANKLGFSENEINNPLKGPSLNVFSSQSSFAPRLLTIVEDSILRDEDYIKRIKQHYLLFKESLDNTNTRTPTKHQINTLESAQKTGRNMPCPCGSEKKYKKCCLNK